jgi:hypothetical protein
MIEHIQRWQELGVHIGLGKCEQQKGKIKFVRNSLRIKPGDLPDPVWDDYNFLFIELAQSGLSCLDIEGTKNSVETFTSRLDQLGIHLSSLFYEKSLNNGLHIYFRSLSGGGKKNYGALRSGDILFDILNRGRAFTSPSHLGNKKYEWGEINPFTIQSLNDIQEVPDWINDVFNME